MANNMTPLTAISQVIEKQLVELRYTDYALLNLVRKAQSYQNNIRWNVNTSDTSTGAGRLTSANANADTSDTIVNANLPIGTAVLTRTVQLLKTDIQQAKTAGVGALKDLIDAHFRSQVIQILRQANAALYTGTGATTNGGILGLSQVASNSIVYGGIDPATVTGWRPALIDTNATDRALTVAMLNNCEAAIYKTGSGNFDVVITTPELVQKYTQLFTTRAYNPVGANMVADLGFSGVEYKGRPVIYDRDCPTGTMYFIDSSQFTLYSRDLKVNSEMESMNVNGLVFNVSELAEQNMYSHKFEIGCALQLKCENRKGIAVVDKLLQV